MPTKKENGLVKNIKNGNEGIIVNGSNLAKYIDSRNFRGTNIGGNVVKYDCEVYSVRIEIASGKFFDILIPESMFRKI